MSKLQPKFKTPDDLAEWLGMSTFESTESKEEVLMQIQDEGEQRLEAACERLGISVRGMDAAQIKATLGQMMENEAVTPSERQAHKLVEACISARFNEHGLDGRARTEILLAYSGLEEDLTQHGKVMSAGRKPGTVGKVRAWIRKYMAKHHDHKPAQAWEAFKKRPPKGCSVSGANIWTDGAGNTGRAWFGTMVGQERPKK
jgi:hypothetical protein